jgi:tyrosyl-tRNA synthetase
MDEIRRLEALQGAEINAAKIVLATEATALVHGRDAAEAAAESARQTFAEGALGADLPRIPVPRAEVEAGLGVLSAFVKAALVPSTGEARRQIKAGGLRLNDAVVADERAMIGLDAFNSDGVAKLSMGKKKHALLALE